MSNFLWAFLYLFYLPIRLALIISITYNINKS
nr:MAG TPA_asm: Photosystem Q(B) protein [Caudoviricetes sp.]